MRLGAVSATPSIELGETVLGAVRGHHAFEGCVEQLATAIRLGVYPRGSTLPPERELAERLGVSRATLREAIAALRAADFVNTTRGRGGGTVVSFRPKKPSSRGARALVPRSEHLRDTLVFRRIVEPGASGPAAHRQADSRFHLALAAVTASPLTLRAVTSVQADLHDMLNAIPVLEPNIDHSSRQHRLILHAVLKGDAGKARRVMESHCDDTAALLRGLLA
jgi:GntR family transcriptional regulator, transcriptional repressor for pyruvate dehydrogenase complex